jgi:hypothetical protein
VTKWGGFSLEEDKPAQSIRRMKSQLDGYHGGLKIHPTWLFQNRFSTDTGSQRQFTYVTVHYQSSTRHHPATRNNTMWRQMRASDTTL